MKTRILFVVLLLSLVGCASINDRVYSDYERPDAALVLGRLPSLPKMPAGGDEAAVRFVIIDGMLPTAPFNLFASPKQEINVSPGPHYLTIQATYPLEPRYGGVDLVFGANRTYRLTVKKKGDEFWLQVWDETAGFEKRTLLKEIKMEPVENDTGTIVNTWGERQRGEPGPGSHELVNTVPNSVSK
jgi:hypothetical protein